jgi:L-rhamnose mutarotase
MPRIAFRLWLKPDPAGIETYVHGHLNPFPGLYELIRGAGIRNYTIWLDGADLLLTREGETPLQGETLDMNNPVHRQWSDTMTPLFDERVRNGAGRPAEVFSLTPDGEQGPAQMTYRAGLRPGTEDAVGAMFGAIPDAVREALREAGVRREWAWLEPGDLWIYRESADVAATETALASSHAHLAWLARLGEAFDDRTRQDGPRRTREVFRCA